jgi:hypothetical protein
VLEVALTCGCNGTTLLFSMLAHPSASRRNSMQVVDVVWQGKLKIRRVVQRKSYSPSPAPSDSAMVFRYRIVLSISECPSHCCTVRRSTPADRHRVAMLNETCESRSRLCRASHVSHMLSDSRENPASDCNQRSGIPVEVLVSLRFPRPSSFDGILRCLRPSLSTLRSVL